MLRLPPDLYEKIKEKATASQMNMTQFIIATLMEAKITRTTEWRLGDIEERITNIERRLTLLELQEDFVVDPREIKKLRRPLIRKVQVSEEDWPEEPQKPEESEKEQQ